MFCEAFSLRLQTPCIGKWRIHQLVVGVLLVGMLTRQGEHIRESEPLALSPRLMFVVQSSVPRVVTIAWHLAECRLAVALHIELIEITAKRGR